MSNGNICLSSCIAGLHASRRPTELLRLAPWMDTCIGSDCTILAAYAADNSNTPPWLLLSRVPYRRDEAQWHCSSCACIPFVRTDLCSYLLECLVYAYSIWLAWEHGQLALQSLNISSYLSETCSNMWNIFCGCLAQNCITFLEPTQQAGWCQDMEMQYVIKVVCLLYKAVSIKLQTEC